MPKGVRSKIKKFRKPPPLDDDRLFDADFSKLQDRVKLKRQLFCREYVKDYNASAAVQRMGYQSKQPWIMGSQWLHEAYTQFYLRTLIETMEEKAIISRNEVLHMLKREGNYHGLDGGAAARISAIRSLAKVLGMEVTKVEGNMSVNGGVMLIPLAKNEAEWEANSKESQKTLKKKVRD